MRLRHDRGGTTHRAGLHHTASTADKPGPREGLAVAIRSVSGSVGCLVAGSCRWTAPGIASGVIHLLESGLQVLLYGSHAVLWHGQQRTQLEAEGQRPAFADGQIAAIAATNDLVMVTRNHSDFAGYKGLQLLDWFSEP